MKMIQGSETSLVREFGEGHLLYGRETARVVFRQDIQDHLAFGALITADQYNNHFVVRMEGQYCPETRRSLFSEASDDIPFSKDVQNRYWQQLAKTTVEGKDLNNYVYDGETKVPIDRMYAFACCALLSSNFATQVHFCLDGLNMAAVFTLGIDDETYHSFTAIELRFIRDHWDILKNKVQFYVAGEPYSFLPWKMQEQIFPEITGEMTFSAPRAPKRRSVARLEPKYWGALTVSSAANTPISSSDRLESGQRKVRACLFFSLSPEPEAARRNNLRRALFSASPAQGLRG